MKTASIFNNGRCQAVRLPAEFAFKGCERVYISRAANGDVVLSTKPRDFSEFLRLVRETEIPAEEQDALNIERRSGPARDPFKGWDE